jgi:hypothetical protein
MSNAFTLLARMSNDAARKRCIMRWREWRLISPAKAEHLLRLFRLEAA